MRRLLASRLALLAAAAALPGIAAAAPLRAGSALPAASGTSTTAATRAATPVGNRSALIGVPIFAVIGLFAAVTLTVLLTTGGNGRSPG